MRGVVAAVCCVVAPVLLVTAGVIMWANRTVLDSGHVAREVDVAIGDPEVSDALIDAVTNRLPQDPSVQAAARATLERVVETPIFRNALSNAVLTAHAALVTGDEPQVLLDLTDYLDELTAEVAAIDPVAAQLIPPTTSLQLLLAERTELPTVWRVTAAMRRVAPALIVLGISFAALGLVLARRRGRWLGIAGLLAALTAIGLWFATNVASDTAVDTISDPDLRLAGDDIVTRLTSGLSTQLLAMAGIGAVAIAAALIIARLEPEDF
jgi:hypothetical protein